jgi:hypothetical protein
MSDKDIKIIEVTQNKNWKAFVNLPWEIYTNDPQWVPPLLFEFNKQLNHSKNPFFKYGKAKFWIASLNGRTVGRIAAIINPLHNKHYGDKTGFFGYFECIENDFVAKKLFDMASYWLFGQGFDKMCGPVNLSTSNECGLLIEGFDSPPVIQMTHNPPYYQKLIDNYGFKKEIDLFAFQAISADFINNGKLIQKLQRFSDLVKSRGDVNFRTINLKDFPNEMERVRILFNDYMSDNWGFVPIEKEDFEFMGSTLKEILVKELAIFAEVDGLPVGFSIAIPDINEVLKKMNGKLLPLGIFKYLYFKNKVSGLRVILMGINKPYRRKGLESIFYYHTILECVKRKYKKAELSWISEDNGPMVQALVNMDAELYKRYRIFNKNLLKTSIGSQLYN